MPNCTDPNIVCGWVSSDGNLRHGFAPGPRSASTSRTMRHAFFADMGGIMIAPRRSEHLFPADAHQLASGAARAPRAATHPPDDIRAVNKAYGLARVVTMGQMAWFCVNCVSRYAHGLSICPLELETLCFILCTTHTFFFWYRKPLDPVRAVVLAADSTLDEICGPF
ncbi:hypothetical protein PspLS_00701 [Pyricularia sp. CBS 133598]|nr:hypothetical protein PspLS_00701 [Pyricularia sp. CBS 133598]